MPAEFTASDSSEKDQEINENDEKMKKYFMTMAEAATNLKSHLMQDKHPEKSGKELEAHLADVRHYSQKLWDALFEFVQFVTCSSHPVASKIKWIGYADDLIDQAFQQTSCSLTKSYHEIMETLTQMARIDPFCRPESYIDFFGRSTFGVALDSIVALRQQQSSENQSTLNSSYEPYKTLVPWFIAGAILAIGLN